MLKLLRTCPRLWFLPVTADARTFTDVVPILARWFSREHKVLLIMVGGLRWKKSGWIGRKEKVVSIGPSFFPDKAI
jgi:hypothetical protein